MGRYELGRVLGQGGAGRVFAAELAGPGGLRLPVALKVLHEGGEALKREARIGGLLRHRHLVDVYEVGEADGVWFCALERCAASLTDVGPLPLRAVVEVGLAVCDALIYARDALGLVHLDIKPDNLLLSSEGVVKLGDLGIARADGFGTDGRVRGTPGYMAPEQRRAGAAVDSRADVYALAVTLLELSGESRSRATVDWLGDDAGDEGPPVGDTGLADALTPCLVADSMARPSLEGFVALLRELPVEGLGLLAHAQPRISAPTSGVYWALEEERLVGRAAEEDALERRLAEPGVQVLLGPAGVGKSRLALAALARWRATPGRRGHFVDLAPVRDGSGLVAAVARVLRVRLGERGDPVERIGRALAGRGAMVVVLDNFEQLVSSAPVVARWASLAPQVRWLITSQVVLDVGEPFAVSLLSEHASVELLERRARERGVDLSSSPAVRELARRLDGLPLALELAAGRLGVLSVDEVLQRLGLNLLRTADEGRHSTLRAALSWSWSLLDAPQQRLLTQLAAFGGPFSMEAAEAVVDVPHAWLDDLGALLRASMVSPAQGGRLRLLDSIRAFAAERLDDTEVLIRHGRYFARFGAPEALHALEQPGGALARERLGSEVEDLVVACRRAVARHDGAVAVPAAQAAAAVLEMSGTVSSWMELLELASTVDIPEGDGLRLAAARAQVLERSGAADRAIEVLTSALERWDGREGRAGALHRLGTILAGHGLVDAGLLRCEEALELAQQDGDVGLVADIHAAVGRYQANVGRLEPSSRHFDAAQALVEQLRGHRNEARILRVLARNQLVAGELALAAGTGQRALDAARRQGDRRLEAACLGSLGNAHHDLGEYDRAVALGREAVDLAQWLGDRSIEGRCRCNLGIVLVEMGQLDEAECEYRRALDLHRGVGNRASEGFVLANLGGLHFERGDLEQAEHFLTLALEAHEDVGNVGSQGHVKATLGMLRTSQGRPEEGIPLLERALEIAMELGRPYSVGVALSYLGCARCRLGQPAEARRVLLQAVQTFGDGHLNDVARALCHLAEAEALAGDLPAALSALERARSTGVPAGPESDLVKLLAEAQAAVERAAASPG